MPYEKLEGHLSIESCLLLRQRDQTDLCMIPGLTQ